MLVETALVQDELRRAAVAVGDESDLGIDDFEKIIMIALRKDLGFRLPGCLPEEVIALARNRQSEVWRELISSDIALEDLRATAICLCSFAGGASPSTRFPCASRPFWCRISSVAWPRLSETKVIWASTTFRK